MFRLTHIHRFRTVTALAALTFIFTCCSRSLIAVENQVETSASNSVATTDALANAPGLGDPGELESLVLENGRIVDGRFELLMVGDSITNNFDKGGPGEPVWEKQFAPLNALNLGFGGDRTNHVLWRLDHLPPLKTAPKAASLMIGTNNICWGSDKPKQAADGVQAIAQKLNTMYPEMKILVLGVFPRRANLDHAHRKQIIELNSYLPDLLKDIPNVTFLDIGPKFLDDKGFLSKDMMPDSTHPSEKGHEIWAEAIVPKLKEMMAK
jgi:lysophospholipase L1-like esterase